MLFVSLRRALRYSIVVSAATTIISTRESEFYRTPANRRKRSISMSTENKKSTTITATMVLLYCSYGKFDLQ
jgi:hypothetical protein